MPAMKESLTPISMPLLLRAKWMAAAFLAAVSSRGMMVTEVTLIRYLR